jgi:hypothetical protein
VKRISKAAAISLAVGAAVLGTAGGAVAHGNDNGASAEAVAVKSPGFGSGNIFQAPFDLPINACGNSLGLLFPIGNAALGNTCVIK